MLRHRHEDASTGIYAIFQGSTPAPDDGLGGHRRRARFRVRREQLPDGVLLSPASWLLDWEGRRYYVEGSLVVPGRRFSILVTIYRWPVPDDS